MLSMYSYCVNVGHHYIDNSGKEGVKAKIEIYKTSKKKSANLWNTHNIGMEPQHMSCPPLMERSRHTLRDM